MRARSIFLILVCTVSAACSGGKDAPTGPDPGPGTPDFDVYTPGLVFSPAYFTIPVGTTVRFNITGVAHDVTFQAVPGAPQSIPVTTNKVVARTFNTKGVFPFDCLTHPGMSGSATVQ